MKRAVVLLSGGLDSATVLAMARADGFDCYALSFRYGQRHAVELEAAARVARALGADEHRVATVDLRLDRRLGAHRATSRCPRIAPSTRWRGDIPITYVPARNALFLCYALAWAEVLGARESVRRHERARLLAAIPTAGPSSCAAFETMARLGTKAGAEGGAWRVHAPLIAMTKARDHPRRRRARRRLRA